MKKETVQAVGTLINASGLKDGRDDLHQGRVRADHDRAECPTNGGYPWDLEKLSRLYRGGHGASRGG